MSWSELAGWVLTAMVAKQPPATPGLTPADVADYPSIAEEIADAAQLWPIARSPKLTASILVVVAYRESRFRRSAVGDSGRSLGAWQTWRGWGAPSAALALDLLHTSWTTCGRRPVSERLAWYAAGGSGCSARLGLSRSRMREALALLR